MKIIVAGSRSIKDRERIYAELDKLKSITELVCGMALYWLWDKDPDIGGVDRYAYEWAQKRNIPVAPFIPDWANGKGAGFARNVEMAEYGDLLVAFIENDSSGTTHMIRQMKRLRKPRIVHDFSNTTGLVFE